jgi:hypothetical protein
MAMKYNNKALKEARNLIAYAKQQTANFKVDKTGLLVGYKYKDTPYAANMLLHEELWNSDRNIEVHFAPVRKNKYWRNAVLKIKTFTNTKPRPMWEIDYALHRITNSPLVIIPLRAICRVIGGNLPYTVLAIENFTPIKYYSLPERFEC